MPLYDFEDRDGNVVELFFSMKEVPPAGEWIEHEGRELRKLPTASVRGVVPETRFVSHSLEQWHPDAEKFDESGQPVFETKRDREEFLARNAANPDTDNVVWNA